MSEIAMKKNGRGRILVALLLQLASVELSRWAVAVLHRNSPERIYGSTSLKQRMQRFETLFEARFGKTPHIFIYTAAALIVAAVFACVGALTLLIVEICEDLMI